jgi:hypothetical protein
MTTLFSSCIALIYEYLLFGAYLGLEQLKAIM